MIDVALEFSEAQFLLGCTGVRIAIVFDLRRGVICICIRINKPTLPGPCGPPVRLHHSPSRSESAMEEIEREAGWGTYLCGKTRGLRQATQEAAKDSGGVHPLAAVYSENTQSL